MTLPLKKKTSSAFKYEVDYDFCDKLAIETQDFPECCGILVLTGFWEVTHKEFLEEIHDDYRASEDFFFENCYGDRDWPQPSKMPSDKFFTDMYLKELGEYIHEIRGDKGSITMAVLNEIQNWQKPALIANGFRLVSDRTVNGSTGNRLYVYIYDPSTSKGKNLKKRAFK